MRCSFAFLPQDTTSHERRRTTREREESEAKDATQKRRSSLWDPRETTSKARALSGKLAENDTNDACQRTRTSSRPGVYVQPRAGVKTAAFPRLSRNRAEDGKMCS
ncbi:UNVERIFIED_CONTAM: hypothetical protein HHA_251650 [Hammondia hammondi]|eukprot:XP_008888302.1 hypothetical protein HHA_251650 [Hammondia hammondi]